MIRGRRLKNVMLLMEMWRIRLEAKGAKLIKVFRKILQVIQEKKHLQRTHKRNQQTKTKSQLEQVLSFKRL
jgi:hypothetical protein